MPRCFTLPFVLRFSTVVREGSKVDPAIKRGKTSVAKEGCFFINVYIDNCHLPLVGYGKQGGSAAASAAVGFSGTGRRSAARSTLFLFFKHTITFSTRKKAIPGL